MILLQKARRVLQTYLKNDNNHYIQRDVSKNNNTKRIISVFKMSYAKVVSTHYCE